MIPHFIVHPTRPQILQFVYDFDDKKTTITKLALEDGALVVGASKVVPLLLRYPVARPDHWYVAVMEVREFGEPAYVERWSWDELERADQYLIEHPKFGLTALGLSSGCDLALVDRFFPDGDDELLCAKVVTLPDMNVVGSMPINAGMSCPVFDDAGKRVAMVLYDQSGCSANVYELDAGDASQKAELASDQIVTDFERGCVAFLPDNELLVWSVKNWSFAGHVGVYDIESGDARFVSKISEGNPEFEMDEEFSFRLENTELALLVEDERVVVGDVGGIVAVDLSTGETKSTEIAGSGAMVQVRSSGTSILALDHEGKLFATD